MSSFDDFARDTARLAQLNAAQRQQALAVVQNPTLREALLQAFLSLEPSLGDSTHDSRRANRATHDSRRASRATHAASVLNTTLKNSTTGARTDPIAEHSADVALKSSAADARDASDGLQPTRQNAADSEPSTLPVELSSGSVVGPYTLDAWIGDGGSASVYRAFRLVAGVRQTVAIKILRRGLNAPEARQQFDRERKVLSVLEHASIARWIDGGVTADGLAYLVLEYVDGQTITSYARAHKLSMEARIRLMIDVSAAVEAAHRALIVHRDLKPGNLLVTEAGQVKLLDFGIAKLLENESENRTQVHLFTPAYAAPEQHSGGTITTATDVYALGVILGELLTGKRFSCNTTSSPSLQIDDQNVAEGTLPTSPERLRQLVKGDLDNILLKALALDPAQRYGSATAFAEDLACALDGRPVLAHPPSRWYRAWKFVRRNRISVGLVSLLTLGILLTSIASVLFALRAQRATERAQISFSASVDAVNKLTTDLAKNLREARGVRAETVGTVLAQAQALVNGIDATDPGNVALEHARIGMLVGFSETYRSVARTEQANLALQDAWQRITMLEQRAQGIPATLRADALLARAQQEFNALDGMAAAADARAALDLATADPTRSWQARKKLASALFFENALAEVRALYVPELAISRTLQTDALNAETLAHKLDFYTTIASSMGALDQHAEAQQMRATVRTATQRALQDHPNSSDLMNTDLRLTNLDANQLLRQEQLAEASMLLQQGLLRVNEAVANDPNSAALRLAAKSLYNLSAQLHKKNGYTPLELQDLRASSTLLQGLSDADPMNLRLRVEYSFAQRRLADGLLRTSRANDDPQLLKEAQTSAETALRFDRELLQILPKRPFSRRYLAASLELIGDLNAAQLRFADAELAYQESLQIRQQLAEEFPDESSWLNLVAASHAALKDLAAQRGNLPASIASQRQVVLSFLQLRQRTQDAISQLKVFDAQLGLLELLVLDKDPKQIREARTLLAALEAVSAREPEVLRARPDLSAELARLRQKLNAIGAP